MNKFFTAAAALLLLASCGQKKYYLLAGTYTNTGSEGIYVYDFDEKDGGSALVSSAASSNPSFIVPSGDGQFLYAVNEDAADNGKGGGVSSFAFDKSSGKLTLINKCSSEGNHPCHLAIDATGKWLTAGNYSTGNMSIFPLAASGAIDSVKQVIQHHGASLDTVRQTGPHIHETVFSPDNRHLYVPDLGLDEVLIYRFYAKDGTIIPAWQPFAVSKPGSGPRHIVFHPNKQFVYLIEELSGTVTVFQYKTEDGTLKPVQTIATTAPDISSLAGCSELQFSPDGKYLYAGNRGQANSIAIYSVDGQSGKLNLVQIQPVLGKGPRFFCFDPSGKFLLVANQDSNEIVIFSHDAKTGLLTDTGKRISIKKPVCLQWIEK
ncbi:MAG: lactonase family protein [Ferruginibacter sp.]